jgi:hypothetical protein
VRGQREADSWEEKSPDAGPATEMNKEVILIFFVLF